jgi:hypothetical protein
MSPFKMKGFPMKSPSKHKKFGQPHPINPQGKEQPVGAGHPATAKAHNVKSPNKQVKEDLKEGQYTYELVDANGNVIKTISKEDYINYQNDPGGDKPTKTTNDPDPYGRKKGGSVTTPK